MCTLVIERMTWTMKSTAIVCVCIVFGLIAGTTPALFAQEHDHGEFGVYGDYLRLDEANNTNFVGVGGRIGFNVAPRVQLEGNMAYDFAQSFTSSSTTSSTLTVSQSSVTLLHGLFGPKVELGSTHARFFLTGQGGFLRFGVNNNNNTQGFTNSIDAFGDSATHPAFYPGVGVEFYVGPVGIRGDVGDFMYWNNGTHNNLSIKFGPQIRF
jgi:hypothetical protein